MIPWLRRVAGRLGGRADEPSAPPSPQPVHGTPVAPATAVVVAAVPEADLQNRFLPWLFGGLLDGPLRDHEQRVLGQLDALIAARNSLAALLPRAPAVIPQLMNSLRDERQSTGALAQRVARDPHLVVEVIRMANGAQTRGDVPVTDIAEAIRRLGLGGLHRAILRVVLKPMFDGQGDSLTARCTQRLWQHSEAKAEACQQQAGARGLDPFEGYLAGLMHNVGWTAALRAVDRIDARLPPPSLAFAAAVEARRDTLFGLLATPWQLSEAFTALAGELQISGVAQARSALGQALCAADHQASLQMLGDAGPSEGSPASAAPPAR